MRPGAMLAWILAVAAACGGNNDRPPGMGELTPAADTLRGTVVVVGAAPMTQVALRGAEGGPDVVLLGDQADAMRRLAGVEVWVEGVAAEAPPAHRGLRVHRFGVRRVDGVPAVDGRLVAENGRLVLVLDDGTRRAIPRPPPALREHVGARVWVAGEAGEEPVGFGVIEPAGR